MPMIPILRRNIRFNLPKKDECLTWHKNSIGSSMMFNTMSIFFPVGERFFIDSVRNYRNRASEDLKEDIRNFIQQEAMHGREHDEYNQRLQNSGIPAEAQERIVKALLDSVKRSLPESMQLAATVSLEHLTAILAGALLENPDTLSDSDQKFVDLWIYHAVEETEHKAVAFDLYQEVFGDDSEPSSYLLRCMSLVLSTSIFFSILSAFLVINMKNAGKLTSLREWKRMYSLSIGRNGIYRKATPDWFDWFERGFHPWDHDNAHLAEKFAPTA